MAHLKDVAREAGVSIASASHALTGSKRVSSDLRERVLAAARRVGYVPHRSAQALRTGRTRTLGVVVPDFTNPFFPALVQAIETAARQAQHGLLIAEGGGGASEETAAIDRLIGHRVDGIVWVPGPHPGPLPDLPAVTLDRALDGCDAVVADHRAAGRAVAEHLWAVGRLRAVLLCGPQELLSARLRREGFLSAWPGEVAFEASVPFRHELPEAVRRKLRDPQVAFDSVVAANDAVAIGVLRALNEAGRHVPSAVAVVGVDDVPWSELTHPPLTTVRQPVRALGREAVQVLLRRIERPDLPVRVVTLPVRLVVRDSSPTVRIGPAQAGPAAPSSELAAPPPTLPAATAATKSEGRERLEDRQGEEAEGREGEEAEA